MLYTPALLSYFQVVSPAIGSDKKKLRLAVNYLTSDIVGLLQSDSTLILTTDSAPQFAELIEMLSAQEITSRVAKDLLADTVFNNLSPKKLAKDKGLLQSNSTAELDPLVDAIIAANPTVADEYRAGKVSVLQFLVGQGMKETKGSANPQLLAKIFQSKLG